MQEHDHDEDDYRGPVTVQTEEHQIAAEVVLRGNFQPIDGRFHWYGRTLANTDIDDVTNGKKTRAVISTPHGQAVATLSEPDPWGRYRITGVGRPPFPVAFEEELELDGAPLLADSPATEQVQDDARKNSLDAGT